jgi:hypothetical protein
MLVSSRHGETKVGRPWTLLTFITSNREQFSLFSEVEPDDGAFLKMTDFSVGLRPAGRGFTIINITGGGK